jgi:hypothetical protein
MSKTPANFNKTTLTKYQQVRNILLGEDKAFYEKKEVQEALFFVFSMLTDKQTDEILKKINVCKEYIRLTDKDMDKTRVRSIIRNRFNIDRRKISEKCLPCSRFKTTKRHLTK